MTYTPDNEGAFEDSSKVCPSWKQNKEECLCAGNILTQILDKPKIDLLFEISKGWRW